MFYNKLFDYIRHIVTGIKLTRLCSFDIKQIVSSVCLKFYIWFTEEKVFRRNLWFFSRWSAFWDNRMKTRVTMNVNISKTRKTIFKPTLYDPNITKSGKMDTIKWRVLASSLTLVKLVKFVFIFDLC